MNNSGIISVGDNNTNQITSNNFHDYTIDWKRLEKELIDLELSNNLSSIKDFADEAMPYVKNKNANGFVKCLQNLGKVGLEIITKTSAAVIVEIIKKYVTF